MSHQTSTKCCPTCGATIPEGAPGGLCPKCLLAGAKLPHAPSPALPATGFTSPPLSDVALAFPQLEILELIGMGGMGCVFKARQPKLERFVALKLLPAKFASDPSFRERFGREARVLARLNHPNIVSVYDFGEAGGFFYLMMEFVDGANLRQAMRAGRFTPEQALAIVPKICDALQFAHGEGILHRDVKPENILLDTKGRVKIADFGIAKLVGEPQPVTQLTATGAAIGTPQYMAPEQLERPQEVDHRADIYSLGVVFYEMLTGELPIGRFAPPSRKTPMDPRVDEVVLRALEKEREKRFQSAGEVKTQVEHLTTPRDAGPGVMTAGALPKDDFILCPPGLPRMAKAILLYCLIAAPLLWFIGLFTFDALPEQDQAAFIQGAFNAISSMVEFLILVILAIAGWRLRGLKPSAAGWLKVALWLHLVGGFLVLLAGFWVAIKVDELVPNAPMPALHVNDGILIAAFLVAAIFEISALVWLHRHAKVLDALCQPAFGMGPHGTVALGAGAARAGLIPKWSRASIVGAILTGLCLPVFGILVVLGILAKTGAVGPLEILLVLVALGVFGMPGTILGWIGLSDIRGHRGGLRGLALAVFAALSLPLLTVNAGTVGITWHLWLSKQLADGPAWRSMAALLIPAAGFLFTAWAVAGVTRWGANRGPASGRVTLGFGLGALLAVILGNTLARSAHSPAIQLNAPSGNVSNEVALGLYAPPRETLVVTGIVLSNGIPVAGEPLRVKLWPPSGRKPSPFIIRWKTVENAASGPAWEIVVEDATSNTIAARLRPANLPELSWAASLENQDTRAFRVTREARVFEVARAFEPERGTDASVDWSVRIQLQSSPVPPSTAKRGIEAEFVLPAHQAATFELVSRRDGTIVSIPEFAAHQVNGSGEPFTGKFILAEDPDDLDSLTGMPRWQFGVVGKEGHLLSHGLGVPALPKDFSTQMVLFKLLDSDQEVIEGLPENLSTSTQPSYGLRIRTHSIELKPGLRYISSGFGTNWQKDLNPVQVKPPLAETP